MKPKANYHYIELDWIKENLLCDPAKPFTYEDLGKKHGLSSKTIRNKASRDGWSKKLAEAKKTIQQRIIIDLQKSEVNSESSVRERQANIARKALDIAFAKIDKLSPEELTVRQAIEILKFALPEERKALGIPDKQEVTTKTGNGDDSYTSVEERKLNIQKADQLADRLLSYLGLE